MKDSHRMPFTDSEKFEINEVEILEGDENDIHRNLEKRLHEKEAETYRKSRKQKRLERKLERIEQRNREKTLKREMSRKREGYHWAFFLASFFIGLGFTAVTESPLPLFLGLGIGFLFFVDPIYQKIIRTLENL